MTTAEKQIKELQEELVGQQIRVEVLEETVNTLIRISKSQIKCNDAFTDALKSLGYRG